jgi:peptide/nickel transport system ATP-binding protein
MSQKLLEIDQLSVEFNTSEGWKPVTSDVSFSLNKGETLALVGESGSGKSVTAMSILDLLPPNARRKGEIRFQGENIRQLSEKRLRPLRGAEIATIFQEPMTAMNPVYTIGNQLIAAITSHRAIESKDAREEAVSLLRAVNMPNPEDKLNSYPHQLSGGQRQRAMIAMAISSKPKLLIADEPTTALDVTVQAEILDLISDLQEQLDMAVLMITHDMGVVAEVADNVVVMKDGAIVEAADVDTIFNRPKEDYTKKLLSSVPHLGKASEFLSSASNKLRIDGVTALNVLPESVLEFKDTVIRYPGKWRKPGFQAVNGIDLSVSKGEIVGLVGESGSGKSTIGKAAVGLVPIAEGDYELEGHQLDPRKRKDQKHLRREVTMVFQDPASSLNPRRTIGEAVSDPLAWQGLERSARKRRKIAQELLERVQLSPDWVDRYPHELSGGQRQRIGIARAIATEPVLMIADEPTSALDVSVQAQVLDLFLALQRELGFSCLFISHDLSVVETLSNRVVVLQNGDIVEQGDAEQVLYHPKEDYTKRLIEAAPVPDPEVQKGRRVVRRELRAQAKAESER